MTPDGPTAWRDSLDLSLARTCAAALGLAVSSHYEIRVETSEPKPPRLERRLETPESAWTTWMFPDADQSVVDVFGEGRRMGDDEQRWAHYANVAAQCPSSAVAMIIYDVQSHLISERSATEWLFARLVDSRHGDESSYYKGLLDIGNAREILRVSIDHFRRRGNEERLSLAASLLSELGPRSWSALSRLAGSGIPECEYFTSLIAYADGVPLRRRMDALIALAHSKHVGVIWGLVSLLENAPELRGHHLLAVLSNYPDDDIADALGEIKAPAFV